MELSEAYEKIYVTEEEKESVKKYLETQVNILDMLNFGKYREMVQNGTQLPSNAQNVKKLIHDFVNVYSAMCKDAKEHQALVEDRFMGHKEEFEQEVIIKSQEMGINDLSKYGYNVSLDRRVPFLQTKNYIEANFTNKAIISPFYKIRDIKEVDEKNYIVKVAKENLQELPQEEIDKLTEEVANDFVGIFEEFNELQKHKNGYSNLLEARADIQRTEKINNFRSKVETLLQGICAQKEKEINQAKDMVKEESARICREKDEEEARRIEHRRKTLEESEVYQFAYKMDSGLADLEFVTERVDNLGVGIFANELRYKKETEKLGIPFEKEIANTSINSQLDDISVMLADVESILSNTKIAGVEAGYEVNMEEISKKVMSGENLGEIPKNINQLLDTMQEANRVISRLQTKVDFNYGKQAEETVKKALYEKVQKTIQNAKIEKYNKEKAKIESERIGIFGGITGRKAFKEEKLKNIDKKIELEKLSKPQEPNEYSIKDMLADLNAVVETDFDGKVPAEIFDLYANIKEVYGNKENLGGRKEEFSDKDILDLANKKILEKTENLPAIKQEKPRFFFGRVAQRRSEANALKTENAMLQDIIIEKTQQGDMDQYKVSPDKEDVLTMVSQELEVLKTNLSSAIQVAKGEPTKDQPQQEIE